MFDNELDKPRFRELIGMFIRVNLKDDNNKFLKYLDNFSSIAEYDHAYIDTCDPLPPYIDL